MADVRQTKDYSKHISNMGWLTFKSPKNHLMAFVKKIPLTPFSILKLQRPAFSIPFLWLDNLIHQNRIIVSFIEPILKNDTALLKSLGYHPGSKPFLPTRTYEINLKSSTKQILSNMRKTTKENIISHKPGKLPIVIVTGHQLRKDQALVADLSYFIKKFSKRSVSTRQIESLISAFEKRCYLVMAYYQYTLVAFSFYLTSSDSVEQYYSGSTPTGKKMKAPTICTWYGIKEAKRRQKKRFDFGGIYDDRFPIKNWINFTQFKKGFGGKERLFPPMLYQWHFPFKKPRPSTA